jgi:mono/diheme cytochrome c family protein
MKAVNKRSAAAILASMLALGLSVPAQADEIPDVNPFSGDKKQIREGKSWFMNVCSPCHGGKADGAGERGTAADLRVFNKGFKRFVETVKNGKNSGRTMTMPAWGAVLDEKTILQIGAFVETLALEGANWKEGVKTQ